MYLPEAFHETRLSVLHAFIRRHSFATLISSNARDGVQISHLPMLLDPARGHHGTLMGHLARPNPQWKGFAGNGTQATAVFAGPHAYISPRWYQTRIAVPTWNYASVYVRGAARVVEERSRLTEFLEALSDNYESGVDQPWTMDDLPEQMREKLIDGIVGIELEIISIDGKFKLSQNRPAADRPGVIAGLSQSDSYEERALAALMSEDRKEV